MSNDSELLRLYVEEHSEGAFAELAREHLNLVYSAALRETTGDGALAEDISQAVFTELARKAPQLLEHPTLAGWLYTTVRHLASNARRAEQRRRNREEEVQSMNELLLDDSPDQAWLQIRPVLDDALHELNDADRAALVLRFLENRTLRKVGATLGLQENAARMRVDRALEKLRGLLTRRGITSTASGLTAALAVGVVTPAPTALATAIPSAALAAGLAAGSTTLTTIKMLSLTKVKLSLLGALIVAGVAAPTWQQTRLQHVRSENAQLRAQQTESQTRETEVAALRSEVERLRKVETDQAELQRLRQWQVQTEPELLRLRGMAGVARRANLEAEQLRAQLARQPSEAATNLITGAMADAMKQAMIQQVEGRLARVTASLHLTDEQAQAARAILTRQAEAMSAGMQQTFSGKFNKEELLRLGKDAGDPDEQIKALLTPEQKAEFPAYKQEEAAYNARMAANGELLQLQGLNLTPEQQDRAFAALYEVSFDQLTFRTKPAASNQAEAMLWVLNQKAKALESVLTPSQMENFRQQQALQSKLMKDIMEKMEGGGGSK